jgi:hypothetical protein
VETHGSAELRFEILQSSVFRQALSGAGLPQGLHSLGAGNTRRELLGALTGRLLVEQSNGLSTDIPNSKNRASAFSFNSAWM